MSQAIDAQARRRVADSRRVMLILIVGAILTIGFHVGLFLQAGIWACLVEAGFVVVAVACAVVGHRLAGRGKLDFAGYAALAGIVIAYAGNEFVFKGATWYIVPGGIMLILLVGGLILQRNWRAWVIAVAAFLALTVLANVVAADRYDIAQSVALHVFVPAVSAVLLLGVLLQLFRVYRRIQSLRVRLIVTMVLLVLLVVVAVGTGSTIVGSSYARQQALRQLESVATLKAGQTDTWVRNLQLDLEAMITADYDRTRMRTVLTWDLLMDPEGARQGLLEGLVRSIERTERFEEIFLADLDGEVRLSTDKARVAQNVGAETFFQQGLTGPYVSPPTEDTLVGATSVYFSLPAVDQYGDTLGVIVGRANLDWLNGIMLEQAGLGESGETYLVRGDRAPVTDLRYPFGGTQMEDPLAWAAVAADQRGMGLYDDYRGASVLSVYRWIPSLQVSLIATQEQEEMTRGAQLTFLLNAAVAVVAAAIAVAGAVALAQGVSGPLTDLSAAATQIAEGNTDLVVEVGGGDEIGAVAEAFNSMTAQLRDLIGGLELRVDEATRSLEAAVDVSRITTSVLDLDALQSQVVDLVQDRFGLYYVGLFLLDGTGQRALLRAGTGDFGRVMLLQGHQLEIGGDTMVGRCIDSNDFLVAQKVGDEDARFDNPLLPDTRSELALPMRARGRVIGAMTLQSAQEEAFSERLIQVLQSVADQVAVAIDNARNFAETQAALVQTRGVQQRYLGQAWTEYIGQQQVSGYVYERAAEGAAGRVQPLDGELPPSAARVARGEPATDANGDLFVVPVVQGDRVIGTIGFEKTNHEWTGQEMALIGDVAEQLGLAVETQRLLETTQMRAAREQLTLRIAEQVRGALDVEEILRVASRSLGRELDASEVVVRLGTERRLLGERSE